MFHHGRLSMMIYVNGVCPNNPVKPEWMHGRQPGQLHWNSLRLAVFVDLLCQSGLENSSSVLSICCSQILNFCIVFVLLSSKELVLVLVFVDKYSGTPSSTGSRANILWYIHNIRVKTIISVKYTDLFGYNLNIWYMGRDYEFHNFFEF